MNACMRQIRQNYRNYVSGPSRNTQEVGRHGGRKTLGHGSTSSAVFTDLVTAPLETAAGDVLELGTDLPPCRSPCSANSRNGFVTNSTTGKSRNAQFDK